MHERTDNRPAPPLTEILLTLPQAVAINYFLGHCQNVAKSLYLPHLLYCLIYGLTVIVIENHSGDGRVRSSGRQFETLARSRDLGAD